MLAHLPNNNVRFDIIMRHVDLPVATEPPLTHRAVYRAQDDKTNKNRYTLKKYSFYGKARVLTQG